jgi:diadenosine tetraphosphate (Ap4A) HIT family hydrolase
MDSPFLDPSRWIASNDLAAAVRDRYPVSPGHTLIVPRRPAPTIFDCTEEELAAIWLLLTECKWSLDREFRPDGYNAGINCGADAGQTIFHAHVHLIPRYRGDHPSPRGGVRHIIPGKGDYRAG